MSTKLYDITDWCKKGIEVEDYPYVGEVDIDLGIGEVVKIDSKFYVPGVVNHLNKSAGVRQVDIDVEPEDKDYQSNLTCPYCGYINENSWELNDTHNEHDCRSCGATMIFERIVTVEYSSSPKRPPCVTYGKWIK